MLLVKCPRCKKDMKCDPRIDISKAVKVCVFCGKSFKIHSNLLKSRIVKKL
jgi:transcription elongation factor Elf1